MISGVPQGSVLGPLLFLIYVSDINSVVLSRDSKLALYVDDILLYRVIQSNEDYTALQGDVDALSSWSASKLLAFNPTKCKSVLLSHKRTNRTLPHTLLLNGMPIENVDSTIAADLTWSRHIQSIASKARRLVGLLYRQFYHYADTQTLRQLYISLIRPHLEYASPVWDPFLHKDIHLLEGVQKFACKVCLKHWDWDYAEMLNLLNLPELQTRRKILKLSLLYKFVNNLAYFPEAPFDHRDIYYSTRNSHSLSFSNLHCRTYQYLHSLFPHTIHCWNTLPFTVVSCLSTTTFRKCLCNHLNV